MIHEPIPAAQGATSDTTASERDDTVMSSEVCRLFSPSPAPSSNSEESLYQKFLKDCRRLRYSDFIVIKVKVTLYCYSILFAHYLFVVSVDLHDDSDNDSEGARVNNRSEGNASVTSSCMRITFLFL